MSNSNSNWRGVNADRRVNLAMTAELALGGGMIGKIPIFFRFLRLMQNKLIL